MLKCRDMAELVTRYLDGGLPARTRLGARWHLWLGGPCRAYVDQVRRTIRILVDGAPPPPPDEARIAARLPDGDPRA